MIRCFMLMLVVWIGASPVRGSEEAWQTVEDVEDLRLLWSTTAYRVHELDTLLRYAEGFGATGLDAGEAQEWHLRALHLFETLKSVDDGGQSLIAWLDAKDHAVDVETDVAHLRLLLGQSAADILALHRDLEARIVTVRATVEQLAAAAGLETPTRREPMPWAEPAREKARQMGFTMSWFLWMHYADDSPHAALQRQQGKGVDDLLASAAKLGVRAIVPGYSSQVNPELCAWRVCEPRPGEYDFSLLDAQIEQLARHDLQLVLPIRSLTTEPPAWALERWGDEARLWRWESKEAQAAPTRGVNLMHPPTRAAFQSYLRALLEHVRTHHAERVLALALELQATELSPELDYSPAAQAHWRQWRSARGNPQEVPIPLPRQEPPAATEPADLWHDWIAWRKQYVTDYMQSQMTVIRELWPELPVQGFAIAANSHHAHSERPRATWPLHGMAEMLDLPGSHATVEPVQVLLRAVGGDRYLSQQAEQNFGSMLGGAAYSGMFKGVMYSVARNGAEKILRYFYSPGLYSYMDRQIDWDGTYSYRLKVREMNRLSTLIGNTRAAPTRLAVLWSEHSYDMDATVYSRYGALGMAYALMSAKVHYDIVTERMIAEGALDSYDWLIIPEQRWLTDETLARARAFANRGGTLFATSIPGYFEADSGQRRGHALADLFGADLAEFTPIQAIPGTYLVPTRPDATWDNRERGASWRRHNTFHPEDWTLQKLLCAALAPREGAEVLLRFADGQPALVQHAYGEGQAYLLGYPFGHEYAFSNTTEMSFGKLYPHHSYPPQMTELERWLGTFLRETLAYPQQVQVPRSRLARAKGWEGRAPTMTYPSFGDGYGSRLVETDEPNHSLTIGLRDREGVDTTYLTVWNRDSAYAVGRGYAHFMAAPTHAIIRINRPEIRAIYDLLNDCHVPVTKGDLSQRDRRTGELADQDKCVSFVATVPSYFGRVYAFSTQPRVELFTEAAVPGIDDAELVARAEALAAAWTPPPVMVWDGEAVQAWWEQVQSLDRPLVISYGGPAWRQSAERLATAIREAGGEATISSLGIRHRTDDTDPLLRSRGARYHRQLAHIDVMIGNDWSNTNLADLTGAWQKSNHAGPILPVSVNQVFPGDARAVVMTTRPFSVRRNNERKPMEGNYHHFSEAPRMLIVGASAPAGALAGVDHLLTLIAEKP